MELKLGKHVFDVSTQALVMGAALADSPADESGTYLAEQGADVLSLVGVPDELVAAVEYYAHRVGVPVVAGTRNAELATRCLRAGASAVDGGVLADPALLPAIVDAGASVLIACDEWTRCVPWVPQTGEARARGLRITVERARWAEAAGLSKSQIIVESPPDQVRDLAVFGYPVLVGTAFDNSAQGAHVTAAMAGARIIRSTATRATKRTVSTVSELLQRRDVAAPQAVVYAGTI